MQNKIDSFTGKYFFLSNFYNHSFMFDGLPYFNAEAAFQAQKTKDERIRLQFTDMQAKDAKAAGKKIVLREDWDAVKDDVMYRICKEKFMQSRKLKAWLLATGNAELEEGNTWGDCYWGVCRGIGRNKLGRILMRVREDLQ